MDKTKMMDADLAELLNRIRTVATKLGREQTEAQILAAHLGESFDDRHEMFREKRLLMLLRRYRNWVSSDPGRLVDESLGMVRRAAAGEEGAA